MKKVKLKAAEFNPCLAPRFSMKFGEPGLVTIYSAHYDRLEAIRHAAISGDSLLIELSLADFKKYSYSQYKSGDTIPEPKDD